LKRWTLMHTLALLAILVPATLQLWFILGPERQSGQLVVVVSDSSKNPRTDIGLVGPKGLAIYPDLGGMFQVPRTCVGKNLLVVERTTLRTIKTIRLQDLGDEPQQLTIPR
jgi:hypothetical protein